VPYAASRERMEDFVIVQTPKGGSVSAKSCTATSPQCSTSPQSSGREWEVKPVLLGNRRNRHLLSGRGRIYDSRPKERLGMKDGIEENPGPPKGANSQKKQKGNTKVRSNAPANGGRGIVGMPSSSQILRVAQQAAAHALRNAPSLGNLGAGVGGLTKARDFLTLISGRGDYKISSNSVFNAGGPKTVPTFSKTASGFRIQHREFLMDTTAYVSFNNLVDETNSLVTPSNPVLFPWLSNFRSLFTRYKIHGLIWYYNPTSSMISGSASPAMGTMVGTVIYDVHQPFYLTKPSLEDSMFAISTVPYNGSVLPLECAPRDNVTGTYLLGDGTINSASPDAQLYGPGKLQFASVGAATQYVSGELYVVYDIEFLEPRLSNAGAQGSDYECSGAYVYTPYLPASTALFDSEREFLNWKIRTTNLEQIISILGSTNVIPDRFFFNISRLGYYRVSLYMNSTNAAGLGAGGFITPSASSGTIQAVPGLVPQSTAPVTAQAGNAEMVRGAAAQAPGATAMAQYWFQCTALNVLGKASIEVGIYRVTAGVGSGQVLIEWFGTTYPTYYAPLVVNGSF
jgi:hypothetical protein